MALALAMQFFLADAGRPPKLMKVTIGPSLQLKHVLDPIMAKWHEVFEIVPEKSYVTRPEV